MEAVLNPSSPIARISPAHRARIGIAVSALPALFLVWDSAIKFMNIAPVLEAFARLGLPHRLAHAIGLIEIACVSVYLVPRTAALGAVLLTGFLGGAIVLHLRVGDPLASHVLFPIYVAALLWAGLWLRDPRVRALLAPRNPRD